MENVASILEREYGLKSGKNAPMMSDSSDGRAGGGGGGGSRGSGLWKSGPQSKMSANAGVGVFGGQDDPFGVDWGRMTNKSEGSKLTQSSIGSRDDLFSSAAYDDVFGGPPKGSGPEGGAQYDDVFGGPPQGAPVYDDLLGGYGGSAPKVNRSSSGSFRSNPQRSEGTHFASTVPDDDDLLAGFGFFPKPSQASSGPVPNDDTQDPFGMPSMSGVGSSSAPFEDDGLLPGFESASDTSRAFSGGDSKNSSSRMQHQQQQRQSDRPPPIPGFDDPVPSNLPPSSLSSALADDGLFPRFGAEGGESRSFREATRASPVQDLFEFLDLDEPPVSSSIPSGSPPFDDILNAFNEPQVPPRATSSSRSAAGGNIVKADRSFANLPQSSANSSFFDDSSSANSSFFNSSSGKQHAEGLRRTTSRSPDDDASNFREGGFPGDEISGSSFDSDPFFPSLTAESHKSAVAGPSGSSGKPDAESAAAWDSPTFEDSPQLHRGRPNEGSHGSTTQLKDAWVTVDDVKLATRPTQFAPLRRPPPCVSRGPGGSDFGRGKSDTGDAEFIPPPSPTSTSTHNVDRMGTDSGAATAAAAPSFGEAAPEWMDLETPNADEEMLIGEEEGAQLSRRRQEAEGAEARREREREASLETQSIGDDDLESIFRHASTSDSSERQRPASVDNSSDVFGEPGRTASRTSTVPASVDDWTAILGATSSGDDSQDRRMGDAEKGSGRKSDRLAHIRDSAANAIAEIRRRDEEVQREQAEKRRAGDFLDAEIKRWAAGKEGNLRALLSTLQLVLWPECGWTPVSLSELINPVAVKKTYRKATLCVHPDKVQQKGARVEQKYVAEKVFDILKEAFSKFNSQELF